MLFFAKGTLGPLHERFEGDDHDAPALMIRPDGRYLAAYSKHNGDRLTHWRVSAEPHDATRALG